MDSLIVNTMKNINRLPNGLLARSRQKGLSIVELMVGMTVGLVISGMAGFYLIGLILENRNVVIETRLMQDMRAAMDVVTRDLRRAGYDQSAHLNVNQNTANPHLAITVTGSGIEYSYSKDAVQTLAANESYGFKLEGGVLSLKAGDTGYQALTDENFTNISEFTITPTIVQSPVVCASVVASPPRINIRQYAIVMVANNKGASTKDTYTRRLETTVKVRNDWPTGSCV